MMGPSGGRCDALRLNNLEELPQWDTLWEGRAMRVPDGWVAEIAIPFRNLSYEPGQTEWGFDFTRYIRRKAEIVRWSSTNPAIELTDVSEAGTLTGITAVTPGLGLDVQPYVALRSQHDWSVPGDGAGLSGTGRRQHLLPGHAGADRHAHLQPGLLRRAARRSAGEHDAVLALLSGDARLLSPGCRQFRVWRPILPPHAISTARTPTPGRSSRAIWDWSRAGPSRSSRGGKLSGEFGGFNIGALSVLTDETPTSPGQVLSVARVTHPVFSQSRVGFIFTNGDPTGLTRNTVAGVDFNYRDTQTIPGKTLQADFYYERSFSNTVGDDDSYGAALNFPNEPWFGEFTYKVVGANFTPALGFVNRNGHQAL